MVHVGERALARRCAARSARSQRSCSEPAWQPPTSRAVAVQRDHVPGAERRSCTSPCRARRRRRRSRRSSRSRPACRTRGSRPPGGCAPCAGPRSARSSSRTRPACRSRTTVSPSTATVPGRPSSSARGDRRRPACSRRCRRRRPGTHRACAGACRAGHALAASVRVARAAHPGCGRTRVEHDAVAARPARDAVPAGAADQQVTPGAAEQRVAAAPAQRAGRARRRPTAGRGRARRGAGRGLRGPSRRSAPAAAAQHVTPARLPGTSLPRRRRRARAACGHERGGAQKPCGGRRDDIRSWPRGEGEVARAPLPGRAQPKVHEGARSVAPSAGSLTSLYG